MKKIIFFWCFVCLFSIFTFSSFAKGSFEYEDVANEREEQIVKNLKLQNVDNPNYKGKFTAFSAAENGNYAIGYTKFSRDYVLVFNENGDFLSGFSFSDNGSFYIELSNEYITVYTVRGALAITLNYGGAPVSVKSVPDTKENNTHWNNLREKEKTVGDASYKANGIFKEYSSLVRTTETGERTVIYEADAFGKISTALPLITSIIFPFACAAIIVIIIKKAKNR